MAICKDLYQKYADKDIRISADEARTILAAYAQQFKLSVNDQEIALASGKNPFGRILLNRVCAIVDEPEHIYIVLNGSIYILNKATSEIKINIRD